MSEIPAVVREFSEDDAQIAGLIENLQRLDISPEDEAAAFDTLLQQRGLGVRELARLIHKDPGYVSRRIRVYEDAELGGLVRSGKLAVSTAERILSVKEPKLRSELLERAKGGELDQRAARSLMRAARKKPETVPIAEPAPNPPIELDEVSLALAAIERLVASSVRPPAQQRVQLRAMNDRLFDWLIRQGPMPWSSAR
jgi:ParB-like chromosome segregation protein Spo0J